MAEFSRPYILPVLAGCRAGSAGRDCVTVLTLAGRVAVLALAYRASSLAPCHKSAPVLFLHRNQRAHLRGKIRGIRFQSLRIIEEGFLLIPLALKARPGLQILIRQACPELQVLVGDQTPHPIIVDCKSSHQRYDRRGNANNDTLSALPLTLQQHSQIHFQHSRDHAQHRVLLQRLHIRSEPIRISHDLRIALRRGIPGARRSLNDIGDDLVPPPHRDELLHLAVAVLGFRAVRRAHHNKILGARQPVRHRRLHTALRHLLIIEKNRRQLLGQLAPLLLLDLACQPYRKSIISQPPIQLLGLFFVLMAVTDESKIFKRIHKLPPIKHPLNTPPAPSSPPDSRSTSRSLCKSPHTLPAVQNTEPPPLHSPAEQALPAQPASHRQKH